MTSDEDKQDALAGASEATRLLYELRGLTAEVEELMRSGIGEASEAGVSRAIIAEAVALTPGRASQIMESKPARLAAAHARLSRITSWPGDALGEHGRSFAGGMTFPPYERRRAKRSATGAGA